jgi:HAD superfamily hydrolase (TIGR01509 family)
MARHHGLIDMVDIVGFSADPAVATIKPFHGIYEFVCQHLGVMPSDCIYVDDGNDFAIEGAQLLGMTTVRVDHYGAGRFRRVVPLTHYRVPRIADISL